MKIYCDPLGDYATLAPRPRRIISLAAGLTESLVSLGLQDRIVGISAYCPRYVPQLAAPTVGDYLKVDADQIRALQPDLLLLNTGIQRTLAQKLHQSGFPVYALPLPNSLHGILENLTALGALTGEMLAARALAQRWNEHFLRLSAAAPQPKPRIYAELWFGRHVRMAGGLTFVQDILHAAGAENIFADVASGYLELDLAEVERRQPDVFLCFSEPEYPVQASDLQRERGWNFRAIQADVSPAHNLIHDGPSMMEAASWLAQRLQEV